MVPIRWDMDIAEGPSGQARVDERTTATRSEPLFNPKDLFSRSGDDVVEISRARNPHTHPRGSAVVGLSSG